MSSQSMFQWKCEPKAEELVQHILDRAVERNPEIATLQASLINYTSSRLFDWIDHVIIGVSPELEKKILSTGYQIESHTPTYKIFNHPGAQLPRIILREEDKGSSGIAVSVECIADFLMIRGKNGKIEGTPLSQYRRCLVSTTNDASLWIVERRGAWTIEPTDQEDGYLRKYLDAKEKWETRPRDIEDEEEAIRKTIDLAEEIVLSLGQDSAAWLVLEVERKYWQARNFAGQLQKCRQDKLGMGWANHDHHTFRSSRQHFHQLVHLFEILGFHCRERFYAGAEAGWGAQVMENSRAKLVLFLDVDLDSNEIDIDFSHKPMPNLPSLGTIGLWCALHGDSILQAGMHHLEAQFLFEGLTNDLSKAGIGMMKPFSDFPYLKQAFTQGEVWQVQEKRISKLLHEGRLSSTEAERFLSHGAVGSHMENLQRREGYKGFNQKNVSVIIKETDPRLL